MSSVGLSPPEEHLSVSIVTAQPSHLEPVDKCLQVPLQSLISCFHHLYLASCRWENAFTLSLNTRNQSIGSSESMRHWASLVGQGGINNMLFISLTSAPHQHPTTTPALSPSWFKAPSGLSSWVCLSPSSPHFCGFPSQHLQKSC